MVNLAEVINNKTGNNKKFSQSMNYWLLLISVSFILHISVLGIVWIFNQKLQKPTKQEAIAIDLISLDSPSKHMEIIANSKDNTTTDLSAKVPKKTSYNQPNNHNINQSITQNITQNNASYPASKIKPELPEISPETPKSETPAEAIPKNSVNSKMLGENKNYIVSGNTPENVTANVTANIKNLSKVPKTPKSVAVSTRNKSDISNNNAKASLNKANLGESNEQLNNNSPEKGLGNTNFSGNLSKSLPGNAGDKQISSPAPSPLDTPLDKSQNGKGVMLTVQNFRLGNGARDIPDKTAQPKLASGKFPNVVYLSGVKSSLGQVVVLRLLVTSQGKVDLNFMQILAGPNNLDYQQLAKNLIKDWEFEPAYLKGQPVDSLLDITIAIEAL